MTETLKAMLHAISKERTATCESHGAYVARCYMRDMWSGCPVCSVERVESDRLASEAAERDRIQRRWQAKIGEAGIPTRFHDRTLASYVADSAGKKHALDFATRYAAEFSEVLKTGRSAIFCGKPGNGKTHLACGIGLALMAKEYSVLFVTVMRAIRRVKDTWGKGGVESETDAIAALVFPDLLILDEVGIQFGSETEKLLLFDILNERYEKRRPTIIISNLTVEAVKMFLGERIYDRLREDGGEHIPFTWESHRRTT